MLLLAVQAGAEQKTLTLEECKALARDADPYLKNARLDVMSAKALRNEARWEYFPSLSLSSAAFHALYPLVDISVTDVLGSSDEAWNIQNYVEGAAAEAGVNSHYQALHYGYGASLSLMQPLYAGGRIASGNALASLGVEAASLKEELQERGTDESVEEKYWTAVTLQEKKLTLERAMQLLDSLERDVRAARDAGLVTDADCLQVSLKRKELESAGLKLKGGTMLAKMDLCNLLGMAYSEDLTLDAGMDCLEEPGKWYADEEAVAGAMQETRLLDRQVRAGNLQKRMALGEALPEVGVGAMYGYGRYAGPGSFNGLAYVVVSIPISDWGKTSQKVRRMDYDLQKARNERDYLSGQIVLKVRQAWVQATVSWEEISVASEAASMARDAYEKELVRFEAGLVTVSDLLQAQNALCQCEDSLTEARIAYAKALNSYRILAGL